MIYSEEEDIISETVHESSNSGETVNTGNSSINESQKSSASYYLPVELGKLSPSSRQQFLKENEVREMDLCELSQSNLLHRKA
jgi:hypothetical protein